MRAPRSIEDSLESVLGIFFSGIRHKDRAAFILCDELVEMSCKYRALEHNHKFNIAIGFNAAWNAPGVSVPANPLGSAIQNNRNTRNNMQHANAAATVDEIHCADAILDAEKVIMHCWPNTIFTQRITTALRVVNLYSSKGTNVLRSQFEDAMRGFNWRGELKAAKRPPTQEEIKIRPWEKRNWGLVLSDQWHLVDQILNVGP